MRYLKHLKMEHLFPDRSDGLCRRCKAKLTGKQTKWCSEKCSSTACNELMFQKGATASIRNRVFKRDKGICENCGLDCNKIQRISDAAFRSLNVYLLRRKPTDALGWRELLGKSQKEYYRFARSVWKDTPLNFGSSCWEADHIREVVNGGSHSLDNLQTLCIPCHKAKTKTLHTNRRKLRGLYT